MVKHFLIPTLVFFLFSPIFFLIPTASFATCTTSETECTDTNGNTFCCDNTSQYCSGTGCQNYSPAQICANKNQSLCPQKGPWTTSNSWCCSTSKPVCGVSTGTCYDEGYFTCGDDMCDSTSNTCLTVNGKDGCYPLGSTVCGNDVCSPSIETCLTVNNQEGCYPTGTAICGNKAYMPSTTTLCCMSYEEPKYGIDVYNPQTQDCCMLSTGAARGICNKGQCSTSGSNPCK